MMCTLRTGREQRLIALAEYGPCINYANPMASSFFKRLILSTRKSGNLDNVCYTAARTATPIAMIRSVVRLAESANRVPLSSPSRTHSAAVT